MRITTARRISQAFFLLLFLWLCAVGVPGPAGWLANGPGALFVHLDPLAALSLALSQGALPRGMLLCLVVVAVALLLGRAFCGWACPLGTLHHLVGWLGAAGHRRPPGDLARARPVKSWVLALQLGAAGGGLLAALLAAAGLPQFQRVLAASQGAGLLDPIPLLQRSVVLLVLPLVDAAPALLHPVPRWSAFAAPTALVLAVLLALNLRYPRFFCRVLCPLGALLGLLARLAPWRVGTAAGGCTGCGACKAACQGACSPPGNGPADECVVCLNCLDACPTGAVGLAARAAAEPPRTQAARRWVLLSLASGLALVPVLRLGGALARRWNARTIRPPGAAPEAAFLARCVGCGLCMRACPTNVIQPAGTGVSAEGPWTPVLEFRIGTGGCTPECVACGQVCPTGAIERLTVERKNGRERFAAAGPVRIGTAFIDRGRCLPWASGRPCRVCEELCPVSPKAIRTRLERDVLGAPSMGEGIEQPWVDPARCTGCGICEHGCPVRGLPAVRVTAEGETREPEHGLIL